MIVDQSGNLIWFHPLPARRCPPPTSARSATTGQTVLTWWQGRILELGFGQGEDEIYNTSYQPIAHVVAGNGYQRRPARVPADAAGDRLDRRVRPGRAQPLGAWAAPRTASSTTRSSQEIDVKTGLVMWEWHALGHIPLRDSYAPMPHTTSNWDYVHVNSIDPGPDGTCCCRRATPGRSTTSTCTPAASSGGSAASTRASSAAPGTLFYWQHDARWQPGGLVSVFDNGSSPPEEKQSRGLLLDPNTETNTVTLVKQFTNPNATLLASSQGDLLNLGRRQLADGLRRAAQLHRVRQRRRRSSSTPRSASTCRTSGPTSRRGARRRRRSRRSPRRRRRAAPSRVEACWNGATAVASWRVLGGASQGACTTLATRPRAGLRDDDHRADERPADRRRGARRLGPRWRPRRRSRHPLMCRGAHAPPADGACAVPGRRMHRPLTAGCSSISRTIPRPCSCGGPRRPCARPRRARGTRRGRAAARSRA